MAGLLLFNGVVLERYLDTYISVLLDQFQLWMGLLMEEQGRIAANK